ncbi:MAG: CoA transferase [Reyranella sp.]|uniref:CaiB/BaiF CoA transferase family protein n=1 Tax=Reyranella sp. TaxID=1929291 RepID=UPI0025D66020|nr:CaiB/BaiF CoA-transferase family protein [Reyranella sp.]MBR2814975.1 CoA transferase [Reyranella sp.]
MSGPLQGLRVVEFAGIGPGPMAAMLLADMGAEVIRIDRLEPSKLGLTKPDRYNLMQRGRRSAAIDLKRPEGVALALRLIDRSDALIEGFRPGTMERLGLGPDIVFARNPRLVYGRMTGWGQQGPLAKTAGHDLNYISLTGALASIGRDGERPPPPLSLIGDFGGGALYLAFGLLCALLEAKGSGKGQVVDAAIVDGAASLMTVFYGLHAAGLHGTRRGTNVLDGGSAIYDVYVCADGLEMSVGAIEEKFRAELFAILGIAPAKDGPDLRRRMASAFRTRTRAEWCALFEGSDACVAPVLTLTEAPHHPHNKARGNFIEVDGVVQPAPAPRFSRTVVGLPRAPESAGASTRQVLETFGLTAEEIGALAAAGVVRTASRGRR